MTSEPASVAISPLETARRENAMEADPHGLYFKADRLLEHLIQKGVSIPCPETVEIGPDLDPNRISGRGVTLHSGCRLLGPKTLILPGVELGGEAPVTVDNCQIGRDVKLQGGFFHECCFLEGATVGSSGQFRGGCLMEERSRAAHTVGLKQTILFPHVTLGSLITLLLRESVPARKFAFHPGLYTNPRRLRSDVSETGIRWLQGLVDGISKEALRTLPGLPFKRR